jgi:predicted RNA-binding protein with TRAM domain
MSSTSTAPLEEGETHHVEIEELAEEGDAIAYVEGVVLVVPDTEITEAVDVEIEDVRDSYALGEVVERHG